MKEWRWGGRRTSRRQSAMQRPTMARSPKDVAQQRVAQVEGTTQEVNARPLLQRDQRGRRELGEEAVEDEQVG